MKNILVLNYEFPPLGGGASPVSYEISKGYVSLGYCVDVVTMGFKDLPNFEIVEGINVYRVKCLRTKKQLCHPWEQATYLYSAYMKVKDLMKDKKYDFCHCHFIIPTGFLALKLKKEFGLNYIITAHGSDVLGHNPRFTFLYKLIKKQWINIINNSEKVVSPSKYLGNKIIQYLGSKDKVIVIPNGIDKDKFVPLEKQKYILVVARLVHGKGIQDLLESIKDINLGEWRIKIVGEGPFRGELDKIVEKYSLQDKVEFLGWVDNQSKEMKNLYGHASIFCQPSYFESFGMTLLEAMQSGCLLIVRKLQVYDDIIGNNGNLKFKNNNDLAMILKNINTNKIELVGMRNIDLVKGFYWDSTVTKYENISQKIKFSSIKNDEEI
ncbi:MAG: glycosyltransferase family 4 protein [Candidatus Absconditabacteria bacterium]